MSDATPTVSLMQESFERNVALRVGPAIGGDESGDYPVVELAIPFGTGTLRAELTTEETRALRADLDEALTEAETEIAAEIAALRGDGE